MEHVMHQTIKGKQYVEDGDVDKLAANVRIEEGLDVFEARIGYVLIYPMISKFVLARCRLTAGTFKFYSHYDYIIEISGDIWDNINEDLKKILLYHELLHVKVIPGDDKKEQSFKIRKHDVQDFRKIIETHGIDWFDELKTVTAQQRDISGEEELDTISL